jgi:outer membrane biosynthesis protein TonB
MFRGVAISTLVHASVLAMAMMSWPQSQSECDKAIERLRRENPGIRSIEIVIALPQCAATADLPIDFEDVGLVSNVTELRKAPDPVDEALPPETEVEETPPEAPPPEAAAEPEEPVPVPDPTAKPEPEKKPLPKKDPEQKPEPLVKKDPPKKEPKKDDLDFLNDIDKVLQDKRQTKPRSTPQDTPDRPALGNADRDRSGVGDRSANTASLQAYVRREFRTFWPDVTDLPTEDQIEVTVRLRLNEDGTLIGSPKLIDPGSRPVGRKGIAVDRALGATRKFFAERRLELPEESYSQWQEIDVVFGPDMRGG